MPAKTYNVKLSDLGRQRLFDLIKRGKSSARMITRARILLLADEGLSDEEIAVHIHTGSATVARTRKRYCLEGLDRALKEKPRPGVAPKLDGKAEAAVTAIACSNPPQGRGRWTLRLIADKLVELGFVESISHVTVGEVLKKTNLSLGRRSSGV
jgi:transposase